MRITMVLYPIPPKPLDPCSKEDPDRPFTSQEVYRALADLNDFLAEQGVFVLDSQAVQDAASNPITE